MADSDSEGEEYSECWIQNFLENQENMFLERLPDTFLLDKFNFYNLKDSIEEFKECYQAILDQGPSYNIHEETKLYFYLHQRYIMYNKQGMGSMLDRIKTKTFGSCQRWGCKENPMIPVGLHSEYGRSKTKVFCYACNCLYEPRGQLRKVDGCAWGSAFAPYIMLLNKYDFEFQNMKKYEHKLYGFTIEYEDNAKSSDSE